MATSIFAARNFGNLSAEERRRNAMASVIDRIDIMVLDAAGGVEQLQQDEHDPHERYLRGLCLYE